MNNTNKEATNIIMAYFIFNYLSQYTCSHFLLNSEYFKLSEFPAKIKISIVKFFQLTILCSYG